MERVMPYVSRNLATAILGVGCILLFFGQLASAQTRPFGGPGGFNGRSANIRSLFDFDGMLDELVNRAIEDSDVQLEPPEPDTDTGSTVFRATIKGPRFAGFFHPDHGCDDPDNQPTFCCDPPADPVKRSSRITVEIRLPNAIPQGDFVDLDSALILVMKSKPPEGEETEPHKMARQLALYDIITVIWWERDDNPLPGQDPVPSIAEQFGYGGDGQIQRATHRWIMYSYYNKPPGEPLYFEELRYDFRVVYTQAYLLSTTFFISFMEEAFASPNLAGWLENLRICYSGGSKRGGGVTTVVTASNILAAVDPRQIVGLFVQGYQAFDAKELSGFHRYAADWGHELSEADKAAIETEPCPEDPCPACNSCAPDSGYHRFENFAIWVHETEDEPHSYAKAFVPASNTANLSLYDGLLILDTVGTHDWINPLGAHQSLYEKKNFNVQTLRRINRNHGEKVTVVEEGEWFASELLIMRAMFNFRYRNVPQRVARFPLHRLRWLDLQAGDTEWEATLQVLSGAIPDTFFQPQYTVWVALSDDRDFRRCVDPVESDCPIPCIDSDLNGLGRVLANRKISDLEGAFPGVLDDDDRFGRSLSSIGDLNGDGVDDLAVGAYLDDDGGTDRGAIWILHLESDGSVQSAQKISDAAGGFGGALDDGDRFGISIANLGDLDGAGPSVAALAVGAPKDDDGGSNRGAVWVLFLDVDGTVLSHQKISDTAGGFTGALDDLDLFGHSVACLGDLDGAGPSVASLAVGAIADGDGGPERGAVWIVLLASDGSVLSHQKISDIAGGFGGGLDDGDHLGSALASIGDLDGDGSDDLAASATLDDDGGADRGAVWILFLNAGGTVKSRRKISAVEGEFTGVLHEGDGFGASLALLGDLDGSGPGVTAIAVGAPGTDDGGLDHGAVWVLHLAGDASVAWHQKISDTDGFFHAGLDDGDRFGRALAMIPDLDGDGADELAVGIPNDDDGGPDRGAVQMLFLGDPEDRFIPITPNSIVAQGAKRIIKFFPPPEFDLFQGPPPPLVAVIVEAKFFGPKQDMDLDDLMVTTWTRYLNEEHYPVD